MPKKMNFAIAVLCSMSVESTLGAGADSYPKITKYQLAFENKKSTDEQMNAALDDYKEVSVFCRDVHNLYEKNSKKAESWRLGIGLSGGVLGVTGAILAAAGTGGVAGGVAAGLAGVASTTLGNAKDGPLDTSFYSRQRALIAKSITTSAVKIESSDSAIEIHKTTLALAALCSTPAPA